MSLLFTEATCLLQLITKAMSRMQYISVCIECPGFQVWLCSLRPAMTLALDSSVISVIESLPFSHVLWVHTHVQSICALPL